jgi:hypothetical protein
MQAKQKLNYYSQWSQNSLDYFTTTHETSEFMHTKISHINHINGCNCKTGYSSHTIPHYVCDIRAIALGNSNNFPVFIRSIPEIRHSNGQLACILLMNKIQ